MRKILCQLLVLVLATAGIFASDGLMMTAGDLDSVGIYAPDGSPLDPREASVSEGCVVITEGTRTVFSSPFGEMDLGRDSIVAITGYNLETPSIYILDGEVGLNLPEDVAGLTVYTTSASYTLSGKGEYIFFYTADSDMAINNSDFPISVYDGLRKTESTISAHHYSDMMVNLLDQPFSNAGSIESTVPAQAGEDTTASEPTVPADSGEATTASQPTAPADTDEATTASQSTSTQEPSGTTSEPSASAQETVIVSGTHSFRDLAFSYSISTDGKASMSWPTKAISADELDSFLSPLAAEYGIGYSIGEGIVSFSFAAGASQADAQAAANIMTDMLDDWLATILVPAAPSFSSQDDVPTSSTFGPGAPTITVTVREDAKKN